MNYTIIIIIAFALALDAFAVALAAGASLGRADKHQLFRLSFNFGLFQFLMPVIGWIGGVQIEKIISSFDHWIAFILLGFIGGKMIFESFRKAEASFKKDITKGSSLIALSIATSIDALAVGLSLAVINVPIIIPSIIIGIVASVMTLIGMLLGGKFSMKFGKKMELIGGIVLIIIGLKILIDHASF